MSQAEREHILAAARDALLTALPDAWAIYVFGSFARAEDWPGSDLDLAVLLPPARSYARHREEIRDILEDFRRTGVGYHASTAVRANDSGSDGR